MRRGNLKNLSETDKDLLADPHFAKAFQWLKDNPNTTPREEPYPLKGSEVIAIVKEYTPQHPSAGTYETHYEAVDLQICLGPNAERIMVAPASDLKIAEEKPDNDVILYTTPPEMAMDWIMLFPGDFVIFDTSDAHLPQCIANFRAEPGHQTKSPNRKIIVKLLKSKLTPNLAI